MKLTGTKTERDIRDQLISSRNAILHGDSDPRLLEAIKSVYPNLVSAFVIHWIPEQAEDEIIVMVDLDKLLWVELDRIDTCKKANIEILNFNEYSKGKRQHLIKMAIAKELAADAMEVKAKANNKRSST
jgi:hypothetical protein